MLKTEHKIAIVVGLLLVGGAVVFTVDQARKSPKKVAEVAQFDGPGVGAPPAARPGGSAAKAPTATPSGATAPRDAATRLDRPAPVLPPSPAPPPPPPPSSAGPATRPAVVNMPPLDLAAVLREKTGLTGERVQTPVSPPVPEAALPAAGGSLPAPGDGGADRPAAAGGAADRPAPAPGSTPPPKADTGSRPDSTPPKTPAAKPPTPTGGTPPGDGGALPGARKHVVEEGDSLWALAEQYYGDGKYYGKIAAANRLTNPDVLTAGTELIIPPLEEPAPRAETERARGEPRAVETRTPPPDAAKAGGEAIKPAAGGRSGADAASPDTTTKPPPRDVGAKPSPGARPAEARGAAGSGASNGSRTAAREKEKAADAKSKPSAAANGRDRSGAAATPAEAAATDKDKPAAAGKPKPRRTHVVAKGETLRSIARTELKNEDLWRKIYELNRNRIKNPNVLPVGLVLVLPEP